MFAGRLPLVLFLHGGQSRGSDNRKNLRQAVARVWATPEIQEDHPCYVLVPQCPDDDRWGNGTFEGPLTFEEARVQRADDPTAAMRRVLAVLDELVEEVADFERGKEAGRAEALAVRAEEEPRKEVAAR